MILLFITQNFTNSLSLSYFLSCYFSLKLRSIFIDFISSAIISFPYLMWHTQFLKNTPRIEK